MSAATLAPAAGVAILLVGIGYVALATALACAAKARDAAIVGTLAAALVGVGLLLLVRP